MEGRNVKIARQLLKLAKSLVAATGTVTSDDLDYIEQDIGETLADYGWVVGSESIGTWSEELYDGEGALVGWKIAISDEGEKKDGSMPDGWDKVSQAIERDYLSYEDGIIRKTFYLEAVQEGPTGYAVKADVR